jgi:predicted 3-demethylubiquinone-9 3-methyltransferase (glyoxalase superfamily)
MASQKITPFLWFDDQAEEAARFYVSLFKNAKLGEIARYGDAGAKASGRPAGSVMTVAFELDGQNFVALNGGPHVKFNHAVSFVVNCDSQAELDRLWDGLAGGGAIQQCGWLVDRFGVTWQVVPAVLPRLMQGAKADKVMRAILTMKKLDIAALERAAA